MIIESNIRVTGGGNVSMGQLGADDGQADASHLYAKKDCRLDLLNTDLIHRPAANALPTTNLTESWTRTSAGIWSRVYTAGGTVDSFILLALPVTIRTATGPLVPPVGAYTPHGYKLTSLDFNYAVTVAGATLIGVTAQTETAQTNNVARANASTTALGTVTYQNPVGTTVSVLPVGTQTNPYQCRVLFGTPAFVPANILTVEIELSLPSTSVVTITGLMANYSLALY